MQHTKRLVFSALFAALTCIATLLIRIPMPGAQGYLHPGDVFVILSGLFLGPIPGFFAAGIGSCLADLIGGYAIYAPASFFLKGLSALCCALLYAHLGKKNKTLGLIFCGIINLLFVTGGYFCYESLIYGVPAAVPGVIGNCMQGIAGLALTCILYPILHSISEL